MVLPVVKGFRPCLASFGVVGYVFGLAKSSGITQSPLITLKEIKNNSGKFITITSDVWKVVDLLPSAHH